MIILIALIYLWKLLLLLLLSLYKLEIGRYLTNIDSIATIINIILVLLRLYLLPLLMIWILVEIVWLFLEASPYQGVIVVVSIWDDDFIVIVLVIDGIGAYVPTLTSISIIYHVLWYLKLLSHVVALGC